MSQVQSSLWIVISGDAELAHVGRWRLSRSTATTTTTPRQQQQCSSVCFYQSHRYYIVGTVFFLSVAVLFGFQGQNWTLREQNSTRSGVSRRYLSAVNHHLNHGYKTTEEKIFLQWIKYKHAKGHTIKSSGGGCGGHMLQEEGLWNINSA